MVRRHSKPVTESRLAGRGMQSPPWHPSEEASTRPKSVSGVESLNTKLLPHILVESQWFMQKEDQKPILLGECVLQIHAGSSQAATRHVKRCDLITLQEILMKCDGGEMKVCRKVSSPGSEASKRPRGLGLWGMPSQRNGQD